MFQEYRSLISKLKEDDAHFLKLFNKHNQLDKEILELEKGYMSSQPIIQLKKEKLKIKDELYAYLKLKDNTHNSY